MRDKLMPDEICFACKSCAKTFKKKSNKTAIALRKDGTIICTTQCPKCGRSVEEKI